MEQIARISHFIFDSFVHIWPYLLITIPLSVGVQLSGASKVITGIFNKKPWVSIILATLVGAVSPFCSCGVIPVIASLLTGGVPLAPVMSFWIASPSMDPEIFFLSTAAIGWKLSVWRLMATFVISLSSGFITHLAFQNGFFGDDILRTNAMSHLAKKRFGIFRYLTLNVKKVFTKLVLEKWGTVQLLAIHRQQNCTAGCNCASSIEKTTSASFDHRPDMACECGTNDQARVERYDKRLIRETWRSLSLVVKFMSIAFFISALIEFYLPKDIFNSFLGSDTPYPVLVATLVGIPFYTSNIAALPLISGLLSLGMNQGAALSFLIAGPVTTLPAMMAVWGIVKPKVFLAYLFFSFFGAILFGYLFNVLG